MVSRLSYLLNVAARDTIRWRDIAPDRQTCDIDLIEIPSLFEADSRLLLTSRFFRRTKLESLSYTIAVFQTNFPPTTVATGPPLNLCPWNGEFLLFE